MAMAPINYLWVVAAAVASYAFGAAYYMGLSRQWMNARGLTSEQQAALTSGSDHSPVPFIVSFVAQMVMAVVFAFLLAHFGPRSSLGLGVASGFFLWLGFVVTTLITNHQFERAKRSLTVIDGTHWLGVLLIQGAVLGLFAIG